jgi:hypothetical protein
MSDGGYIEGGPVPLPRLRALEVLRIAAARAKAENEELARATAELGTAIASRNGAPDAS